MRADERARFEGGTCRLEPTHRQIGTYVSDRTSRTRATADQLRLLIHTAAYWLLHGLRGLGTKGSFWREAPLDTLRLGPIKVAGRVTEKVVNRHQSWNPPLS